MRFQNLLSESPVFSAVDAKACIATAIGHSREVTSYFDLGIPEQDAWWNLDQRIQAFVNGDLPDAAPNSPAPETPTSGPSMNPPTILVIDDEPAIGKMLAYFLKDFPLAVDYHETPPDPSQLGPDVVAILCDVHLEQRMMESNMSANCGRAASPSPIMMMSGDLTRNTVMKCIDAGIVDYLVKPLTKERFLEKLHKHDLAKWQTAGNLLHSSKL